MHAFKPLTGTRIESSGPFTVLTPKHLVVYASSRVNRVKSRSQKSRRLKVTAHFGTNSRFNKSTARTLRLANVHDGERSVEFALTELTKALTECPLNGISTIVLAVDKGRIYDVLVDKMPRWKSGGWTTGSNGAGKRPARLGLLKDIDKAEGELNDLGYEVAVWLVDADRNPAASSEESEED